jgi:hypothetical protein
MRKAAGIILISIGVFFLCILIDGLVVFGIGFFPAPFVPIVPQGFIVGVLLLVLVVAAAFRITGGIFCLRRKYWRVCLASASFAVFFSFFFSGGPLLGRGASLWSGNILMSLIAWVMLFAGVIAVIFILRTKKEWQ